MDRIIALALATVAIVFLVLTLKASVIAMSLSFYSGRPQFCRRIYNNYSERPWRSAVVGLANTLVAVFFILVLLNMEVLALVGIGMATALCAIHLAGRTAHYRVIAERLSEDIGAAPSPGQLLRGALAAELTFLVPIIGQLLFLGVTMRSAGACIMAMLSQPEAPGEAGLPTQDG
jgi:hypothetical protein